jgi:hypothetical protein
MHKKKSNQQLSLFSNSLQNNSESINIEKNENNNNIDEPLTNSIRIGGTGENPLQSSDSIQTSRASIHDPQPDGNSNNSENGRGIPRQNGLSNGRGAERISSERNHLASDSSQIQSLNFISLEQNTSKSFNKRHRLKGNIEAVSLKSTN